MNKHSAITRGGRSTLALCAATALVELLLSTTSTEVLRLRDASLALYIASPFVLLSGLVWWHRRRAGITKGLLILALVLSAWGLYAFGMESYQYHTDPDFRRVQRTTAFVVPLVQDAVVVAVGFGLALWRGLRRKVEGGRG